MIDTGYNRLVSFAKVNQCFDKIGDSHIAKLFHGVMKDLSFFTVENSELVSIQGTRIVEPLPARKFVVHELHTAHSGLKKSVLMAQQFYYWAGMRWDIKSYIDACVPCQQAEAAVKNMKSLVLRCKAKGENLSHALAAWRNMTRQDGTSPIQIFFGRRQRLGLPMLPELLDQTTVDQSTCDGLLRNRIANRDEHTAILDNFAVVQNRSCHRNSKRRQGVPRQG